MFVLKFKWLIIQIKINIIFVYIVFLLQLVFDVQFFFFYNFLEIESWNGNYH